MLNSFGISLLCGIILGFMAGLGIGGGSLLILWLTLALDMDPTTARAINLLFFITAAGTVSFFRWRKGTLEIRSILPAIICGCIFAFLFSHFSTKLDIQLLKKLFGILLLVTGFRELFYRPKKDR